MVNGVWIRVKDVERVNGERSMDKGEGRGEGKCVTRSGGRRRKGMASERKRKKRA